MSGADLADERRLHYPVDDWRGHGLQFCNECGSASYDPWPCLTARLLDEVEASRAKLTAADTFGTNLVIALNDYSEKLQAIAAEVEPWADWVLRDRILAILDGPTP